MMGSAAASLQPRPESLLTEGAATNSMPHELIWEPDGVHKRFWGTLSGGELALSVEAVAAHPDFDQLRFILNDFLDVDHHEIDAASLERILVSRLGSRLTNPRIRVMLVTTNTALFALSDVSQPGSFPATNETKGFATLLEARAWLGQQPRNSDLAHRPLR